MPSSDLYVSEQQLKEYLRADHDNVSRDDALFGIELDAACREIDRRCGRVFWQVIDADDAVTARTYGTDDIAAGVLRTDDFWTTDGLVVKTDDDDDGTYETTWTITTDYVVEPAGGYVDGLTGFPYWRILPVGSRSFPTSGNRRRVQVSARWGWAAVPVAIQRATMVAVAASLKVRDAPHGIAGMGEFGAVRVPPDALRSIEHALTPYRRIDRTAAVF